VWSKQWGEEWWWWLVVVGGVGWLVVVVVAARMARMAMSLPSATATSATVECKIMYLLRMSEQRYGTRKFIENILLK